MNRVDLKRTMAVSMVAMAIGMAAATPAIAQATVEENAQLALEVERLEAMRDIAKIRREEQAARLSALGLSSDATGKTELGEKGGQFEGWLLSSYAINQAAGVIGAALDKKDTYIFLAGDEAFDMGQVGTMRAMLAYLTPVATDRLARAGCAASAPDDAKAAVATLIPYVGALLGAFKTDSKIAGYEGPTNARMVITALGHYRGGNNGVAGEWIIPGAMIAPVDASNSLILDWNALAAHRVSLETCRKKLATPTAGDATKARIAVVDQALAEIDAFAKAQIVSTNGVSPLITAARLAAIADKNPKIVRIHVEKAGGSIVTRSNLFTALGMEEGIGITGGAVIGWQLYNPVTGALERGGNLICRTQLSGIRAVQRGKVETPECTYPAAQTTNRNLGGSR